MTRNEFEALAGYEVSAETYNLGRRTEMAVKEFTLMKSYTKCIKCGRTIAITRQFATDKGFEYETENAKCRYIDKWGCARNFCNTCIK